MNRKSQLLAVFTASVTGVALLAAMIIRAFVPRIILPDFDATTIVSLTLSALLLDRYICGAGRRDYSFIPLYSAFIFGVFPFAASLTSPIVSLKSAVMGMVIFTVLTFLFDTVTDRLSSGADSKLKVLVPAASALGLFLAVQGVVGCF